MLDLKILEALRAGEISVEIAKEALLSGGKPPDTLDDISFPLNQNQKGIWAFCKSNRYNSSYNFPICFRVAKTLEIRNFKEALAKTLRTFSILNACIELKGYEPHWKLKTESDSGLEENDITGISSEEEREAFIRKKSKIVIDIDGENLYKNYLFHTHEHYIVLLVFHHLVIDGKSIIPLLETLFDFYESSHKVSALGFAREYRAYVADEGAYLLSEEGQADLHFWRNLFFDKKAGLKLNFGRSSDPKINMGETYKFELQISPDRHLHPASIYLAVFIYCLHLYANEEDVAVKTLWHGRGDSKYKNAVGNFLNPLVIGMKIDPNEAFSEFSKKINTALIEAMQHSVYPYAALLKESEAIKSFLSEINIGFYFQNFISKDSGSTLSALTEKYDFKIIDTIRQVGEFEFALEVYQNDLESVELYLKYNSDQYESQFVKEFSKLFKYLINAFINNPTATLSNMPLPLPAGQSSWSGRREDRYTKLHVYQDLLQPQLLANSKKIAVLCGENKITYGELLKSSQRLALTLYQNGVRPGDAIGIYCEPSIDIILSLLAIMMLDAIFVPLDPHFPADYIESIVRQVSIKWILTNMNNLNLSSDRIYIQVNHLVNEMLDKENSAHFQWPTYDPKSTAYIIHTSGSTGKPKGVMITHESLSNLLLSISAEPGISKNDRFFSLTTICFDIAILELLGPLINGAICIISTHNKASAPSRVVEEITKSAPTILQATPSTLQLLLNHGWCPINLKILSGGERLGKGLADKLLSFKNELWNMYGPTETTIWSAIEKVRGETAGMIGLPIPNTQFYVLNNSLQAVPLGGVGELCISGLGLAKGYLKNDELTRKKFVSNPFEEGGRLYKTGDLVRQFSTGKIELIGRKDTDVKVRGYRIDLSAIESLVLVSDWLTDALAVIAEVNGINEIGLAYISKNPESEEIEKQLREYLSLKLPIYMVPTKMLAFKEFPLTKNGKKDRKKIEAFFRKSLDKFESFIESKIHDRLSKIFQEVLKRDVVNFEFGFFDLGGHSVSAAVCAELISQEFNISFEALEILKAGSLSQLEERITLLVDGIDPNTKNFDNCSRVRTKEISTHEYKNKVAIIGIAAQFPGSNNFQEFWENLIEGKESIEFYTRKELHEAGLSESLLNNKKWVPIKSSISGKEAFDATFFNILPRDAEFMDPQTRLLLQNSYHAFEDAGYIPSEIPNTAVYMSSSNNLYQSVLQNLRPAATKIIENASDYVAWLYAQGGTTSALISYKLGLKGPSIFTHTNCSSSLVSLHLAKQSILSGEVDYALVGAASVSPSQHYGYIHQSGLNFSSDGHVRAFDENADGMIGSEGLAVVLLKNAEKAVQDKDNIYALICGTAVNNDGSSKSGFYAPSFEGQKEVISKALSDAKVDPETVSYIEAHGTGTLLGDPIEVAALAEAYMSPLRRSPCGLGSVKSNIGHLDTATGLAGLIKLALALKNRTLPRSINVKQENRKLNLEKNEFYIAKENQTFSEKEKLRFALNSTGIGGTNSHVILESYQKGMPAYEKKCYSLSAYLLPLSAESELQLKRYCQNLLLSLERFDLTSPEQLSSLCYTLQTGRKSFSSRIAILFSSEGSLKRHLLDFVHDRQRGRVFGEAEDLEHVAIEWCKGNQVRFEDYYSEPPEKMSLPGYPFGQQLFSLLHSKDLSDNLLAYKISKDRDFLLSLNLNNNLIKDHVFQEKILLPAVMYLEIAVSAYRRYRDKSGSTYLLRNIAWVTPFECREDFNSLVIQFISIKDELGFKITSNPDRESIIQYCLGSIKDISIDQKPSIDLKTLLKKGEMTLIKGGFCYQEFKKVGIYYGDEYQGIQKIFVSTQQPNIYALAHLDLSKLGLGRCDHYAFDPAILDAAFQATQFVDLERESKDFFLPYAAEEIIFYGNIPSITWAYIRRSPSQDEEMRNYEILMCDEFGNVYVEIKSFSTRRIGSKKNSGSKIIMDSKKISNKLISIVKEIFVKITHIPENQLDVNATFDSVAIDSVKMAEIISELEQHFGSLRKTLLFEYKTLSELAHYLEEEFGKNLGKSSPESSIDDVPKIPLQKNQNYDFHVSGDIAIIGLNGRYPGANDLDQLWENLCEGRDSITNVPESRWHHEKYFHPDKNKLDSVYSKWGGFIDGIDEFDASFFNISPIEAEYMDPQERIFLECVYATLEDAGYTKENIQKIDKGKAGGVGLFVGSMYEEYQIHAAEKTWRGELTSVSGVSASIANRVSHHCNFTGPSITLNTMCSSSLTAVHLACQAIRNGDCQLAIAGGVNANLHINKYIMLSQGRFLSTHGRCKPFSDDADGYVPSEGVGAILLKSYDQAIIDNDNIYAIIKATHINHGGKTHSYSAPNPIAQADVIFEALEAAKINPRQISYVEAHGTGTSLGDPIEINGLTRAFSKYTNDKQFCALGSIKSNIGHCESASGIAGLTKVLLQMKYKKLVPSIHAESLNPDIYFKDTAFYIQETLAPWEATIPRMAAISSFGAGGSNAHLILQEHIDRGWGEAIQSKELILLSAKTAEQLQLQAVNLLKVLRTHHDLNLTDIAYTLQVGREAFKHRIAIVVDNKDHLIKTLECHLELKESKENIFTGSLGDENLIKNFLTEDDLESLSYLWLQNNNLEKLARLWVCGYSFEWSLLNPKRKVKRISLPTYPYERRKFFIQPIEGDISVSKPEHPLLHKNQSTFSQQRFLSHFSGSEFFFKEHVIFGKTIFPATAYLEMVVTAMRISYEAPNSGIELNDILFRRACIIDHDTNPNVDLNLILIEKSNACVFSISNNKENELNSIPYCTGKASVIDQNTQQVNIDVLKNKFSCKLVEREEWYLTLKASEYNYGAGFQGINAIYSIDSELSNNKLLIHLEINPEKFPKSNHACFFNVGLLDAALQGTIPLAHKLNNKPSIPFSIQKIRLYWELSNSMWGLVESRKVDNDIISNIQLYDSNGVIVAEISGFSTRTIDQPGVIYFYPDWVCSKDLKITEFKDKNFYNILKRVSAPKFPVEQFPKNFQAFVINIFSQVKELILSNKSGRILFQLTIPKSGEGSLLECASGLFKTASQENPKFMGQILEIDSAINSEEIELMLDRMLTMPQYTTFRLADTGDLEVKELRLISNPSEETPIWNDDGVHVISGGAGGLGLLVAEDILTHSSNATIVLLGRSELSHEKHEKIKNFNKNRGRVYYEQIDITRLDEVKKFIKIALKKYLKINSIIHVAGLHKDEYLINKKTETFEEVISPKILGAINLDIASMDCELDRFILFSSISGLMGNVAQSDYALGNAFLDSFANYRNALYSGQKRKGKTFSLIWPYWESGGMRMPTEILDFLDKKIGIKPLAASQGFPMLYYAVKNEYANLMVLTGDINKIRENIPHVRPSNKGNETEVDQLRGIIAQLTNSEVENIGELSSLSKFFLDDMELLKLHNEIQKKFEIQLPIEMMRSSENILALAKACIQNSSPKKINEKDSLEYKIKIIFSETLKMDVTEIRGDSQFSELGLSSVLSMHILSKLEGLYGPVPVSLFSSAQTIDDLIRELKQEPITVG